MSIAAGAAMAGRGVRNAWYMLRQRPAHGFAAASAASQNPIGETKIRKLFQALGFAVLMALAAPLAAEDKVRLARAARKEGRSKYGNRFDIAGHTELP
ncbi:MAG: hypothetical protein V1796_07060 [Pseudomonadota bacterium]